MPVAWGAGAGEEPDSALTHVTSFSECVMQAPHGIIATSPRSLPSVMVSLSPSSLAT